MSRFYFRPSSGSSCPSYTPGLYTKEEVDDLVNIDSYIPVASAEDLDNIRTGVSTLMGVGTFWVGEYVTGLDKKYVQVKEFNAAAFGLMQEIGSSTSVDIADKWQGTFDGNELNITDLALDSAYRGSLFTGRNDTTQFIRNVRLVNATKDYLIDSGESAGLLAWSLGTNSILENCEVSGSISSAFSSVTRAGGIVSAASDGSIIRNCRFEGTVDVVGTSGQDGLICGFMQTGSVIHDCEVVNSSLDSLTDSGLICGYASDSEIYNCTITNSSVNSDFNSALICGSSIQTNIYGCETDVLSVSNNDGGRGALLAGYTNGGDYYKNRLSGTLNGTAGNGFGALFGYAENVNTARIFQNSSDAMINGFGIGTAGLAGLLRYNSIMSDCEFRGTVSSSGTENGGLVGRLYNGAQVKNSYCACTVTGGANTGGAVGVVQSGGSATSTYWDTDIGPATSAAGTGKTTSELQTPTTNSGIYSAWTIPPWNFNSSSEYPTLDGGSGADWTPAEITTACWIDPSDDSTIIYAAGNLVNEIADKSGNSNNFSAFQTNARPIITTFMGQQVVRTFIPPSSDRPAFIPLPFGGVGSYFRVVYFNDPLTVELQDGGSPSIIGLVSSLESTNPVPPANYGTPSFYQDGTLQSWPTQGDVYNSVHQNFSILQDEDLDLSAWSNQLQWGAYPSSSVQTVEYLGEIIWIAGNVSTPTRQRIEGYLAWKWGKVSKLPDSHPYKNYAPKVS